MRSARAGGSAHSPAPEISALPDPYDSVANGPYRLHDASFYKGRYYLYFGPVPAVVLFLPFSLLGIGNITEALRSLCLVLDHSFAPRLCC
jgi:hypothetical protein